MIIENLFLVFHKKQVPQMIGKQQDTIQQRNKNVSTCRKDHKQQNVIQESQSFQALQVKNLKKKLCLSKYKQDQKQQPYQKRQLIVVYLMYKEQTLSLFVEKGTSLKDLTKMMYKQIHNYEKETHSLSTVILKNCLNRITGFQTIDNDLIWDYNLKINSGNIYQQKNFQIFTHDNLRMPFKIYGQIQSDAKFQGSQFLIRNYSDGKWGILKSITKSSLAENKLNGLKKSLRINFNVAAQLIKSSYNEVSQLNWIQTKNHLYITTQFIPETLQKYLSKGILKGDIYKLIKYWARLYLQVSKIITNNHFHVFKRLTVSSFTFESQTKQLRLNVLANSFGCINAFQKINGSKNTFDIGSKRTVQFQSIKIINSRSNLDVKKKMKFKKDLISNKNGQKQNENELKSNKNDLKSNKKDLKQNKKDLKQNRSSKQNKKLINSIKQFQSNENNDLKNDCKIIISGQSLENQSNRKSSTSNRTNGAKITKKFTNVFYQKAFQNLIKQLKGFLLMNQSTYLKDQIAFIQWVLNQILDQSFQFSDIINKINNIVSHQNQNHSFNVNCQQKFQNIVASLKHQYKNSNFIENNNSSLIQSTNSNHIQNKNLNLIQNIKKQIDRFFKNQHFRRCKQNEKTTKVIDLLETKILASKQNIGNIVEFEKQQKRKSILNTKQKQFIKQILNQYSDTQKFIITTKQNNISSIQNYMKKSNSYTKNQMVSKIKSKYQKFFQKTKTTSTNINESLIQNNYQQNLLNDKLLINAHPKISINANPIQRKNIFDKKDINQKNFSLTNTSNQKKNINLKIKIMKKDYQHNSERITHRKQQNNYYNVSPKFSKLLAQERSQILQSSQQKNKTQHKSNQLLKNSFYTNRSKLNESVNASLIKKDNSTFNNKKYGIYFKEAEKYLNKIQQYRQKINPHNKSIIELKLKPSKFNK